MRTVNFSIKPVTRYIVSRAEETDNSVSGENAGEFDSAVRAANAALAFANQETKAAQPADHVVRADGVSWDRETGRWSDEAAVKTRVCQP